MLAVKYYAVVVIVGLLTMAVLHILTAFKDPRDE